VVLCGVTRMSSRSTCTENVVTDMDDYMLLFAFKRQLKMFLFNSGCLHCCDAFVLYFNLRLYLLKRGDYRTVLSCIVYQNCTQLYAHIDMSSSYR